MSRRDLLCLSHLRWGSVYQRPQHLMARAARQGRVFYLEEPLSAAESKPRLERRVAPEGVVVCQPLLPIDLPADRRTGAVSQLLEEMLNTEQGARPIVWHYTPMMGNMDQVVAAASGSTVAPTR